MELIDVMLKRRSIRKYKNDDIPAGKIEKIIDAGLLAPTSRNRKPCEFIVVKDRSVLEKLSKVKASGSGMLAESNCAIVVVADTEKSDTWIEDSSIALTYMDLMASSIGIGSCWTQIHLRYSEDDISSEKLVSELLDLSDKYRIVGILSLGIPDIILEPHSLDDLDKSKVRFI